jgi:YHS domain-containing protein
MHPIHYIRSLAVVALVLVSRPGLAGEFFEADGFALRGYDAVAYVEDGKPTKGRAEFSVMHKGSTFLFASAKNQAAFAAKPDAFAPQFGGFCALGTANGYKVATEPDAFRVVDGKLYLNYNRKVLDLWLQDTQGYIERANRNWPEVSRQPLKE